MDAAEREYVKRVMAGDRQAYGPLIEAYQGMVFATALNITGNYSDSEDVVQEAFLRAYDRLRTLSDGGNFVTVAASSLKTTTRWRLPKVPVTVVSPQ